MTCLTTSMPLGSAHSQRLRESLNTALANERLQFCTAYIRTLEDAQVVEPHIARILHTEVQALSVDVRAVLNTRIPCCLQASPRKRYAPCSRQARCAMLVSRHEDKWTLAIRRGGAASRWLLVRYGEKRCATLSV